MVGVGVAGLVGAGVCLAWQWRREVGRVQPRRERTRRRLRRDESWLKQPVEELVGGETGRLRVPVLLLAAFGVVWVVAAGAWGRPWLASILCLAFLLLLALSASILETTLLALRVARDRRDGVFEELLTTPLTADQVVDGYVEGTRRLTRRFRWWMAGMALGIWGAAIPFRSWTLGAFLSYAMLGGVLVAWTAARERGGFGVFRVACFTGRTSTAFLLTGGGAVFGNLYNLWNLWRLIRAAGTSAGLPVFPSGSPLELWLVLVGAPVVVLLVVVFSREARSGAASRLAREELRRLVQEPLPQPGDPRLKSWRADQPVPEFEPADPSKEAGRPGKFGRIGQALGRLNPFRRVTRPGRGPRQ